MIITWQHIKSAIRGMVHQGATDEQILLAMSHYNIDDLEFHIKEIRKEISNG